jgi:hypothetical protein
VGCPESERTRIFGESCPIDSAGRLAFLIALQNKHELFWRSLNDLWRGLEERRGPRPQIHSAAYPYRDPWEITRHRHEGFWLIWNDLFHEDESQYRRWLHTHHVVNPWLGDITSETIIRWAMEPESPAANLIPGYYWFAWLPPHRWSDTAPDDRDFAPVFKDPSPRWIGPDDVHDMLRAPVKEQLAMVRNSLRDSESLDDFRRRMVKEFHVQLNSHIRRLRRRQSKIVAHSKWTALRFAGKSYKEIAWTELAKKEGGDHESTVRKAVIRFANRIRLTLPEPALHQTAIGAVGV